MVGGTNSWWASDPSVRGELSGGRVRRAGGAGRRVRHCVGARPSRGRACDGDAVVLWGVSEVHQRMFVAGVSVDANQSVWMRRCSEWFIVGLIKLSAYDVHVYEPGAPSELDCFLW